MECVFCKIINKELPAEIVYEDEKVIAFNDIKPIAPVHILIVPREHIGSVNELREEHKELMGHMVLAASKIAQQQGISKSGYRLIFNTGYDAGQTVDHIHLHLIGGKQLPWA